MEFAGEQDGKEEATKAYCNKYVEEADDENDAFRIKSI